MSNKQAEHLPIARALAVVAGIFLAAAAGSSLVVPWLTSGPGASLAPLDLSRNLLSGAYSPLVPRWVGLVILSPAIGFAVWLIGLSAGAHRGRVVAIALLATIPAAVGARVLASFGSPSLVPLVICGAVVIYLADLVWMVISRRRSVVDL